MRHNTPLRYPGGKNKLANYIKLLLRSNGMLDCQYAEPYAGGAGVALSLLFHEYVSHIHINDLNGSIYSFWHSVIHDTQSLCDLIEATPVTITEWRRQREIQRNPADFQPLHLGFSTFYLNRTNRSGIINGGVIGGQGQEGEWKIDARYNKAALIQRIRKIARYRNRISLYRQDAQDFIRNTVPLLPEDSFIYFDPPYYVKGQGLYQNFYKHNDHVAIAAAIRGIRQKWIVTYDNVPQIEEMYDGFRSIDYELSYSAADPAVGSELMFFADGLEIPTVPNPTKITDRMLVRTQATLF